MKERERENESEGWGRVAELEMNEGTGRAEGGGVHGKRKEARKGTIVEGATSARTEETVCERRTGQDAASSSSSNSSSSGIYYSGRVGS